MQRESAISKSLENAIESVKTSIRKEIGLKNDKLEKENVSASEVFDTKYRPKIWNHLLDHYDAEKDHKQAVLKEVIMLDTKLFRDFLKANNESLKALQYEKSDRCLATFNNSKVERSLKQSDEFKNNQELNLQLLKNIENILNYFYMIEFYIFPKLKHKKHQPLKGYWSFGLMVNSLMYKSLGFLIQSCSTILDTAFNNATLSKNLLSLVLMAYMGIHPAMLLSMKGTQLYLVLGPLLAKFLKWAGLFSYLTDILTERDALFYLQAMNQSVTDTNKVIEELRELIGKETSQYLEKEDSQENEQQFLTKIKELMDKFGCNFTALEKFVDNKTNIKLTELKDDESWLELQKSLSSDLEDLKSSYMSSFYPQPKK